ncbi:unnamed protein product, partial [Ectocarpus sp. 12 AP-2014]
MERWWSYYYHLGGYRLRQRLRAEEQRWEVPLSDTHRGTLRHSQLARGPRRPG